MLKLKTPGFWSSDVNSWLIGKVPDAGKDLRAEGEEGIRGWDGWMASLMQWTWTWANSRRWWGAGRPGLLQSMGSQRVGHSWVTEQQQKGLVIGKGEAGETYKTYPMFLLFQNYVRIYVILWHRYYLYTTTFKNYWGRKGELQGMGGRRQSWVMESSLRPHF